MTYLFFLLLLFLQKQNKAYLLSLNDTLNIVLQKYEDIKNGKQVKDELIEAPSDLIKHQKEQQEKMEKQKEEESQAPLIDFDSDPIVPQNNAQSSIPQSGSNSNFNKKTIYKLLLYYY